MRKVSYVFYGTLLILGVLISCKSLQLGYGEISKPDSGFLPFWCGAVIILLSASIIINELRSKIIQATENFFEGIRVAKPVSIIGAMILYCLLLNRAGFLLSTFLCLILIIRMVWNRNWTFVLGTSVLIGLAFYGLFYKLMDVQLPPGILRGFF